MSWYVFDALEIVMGPYESRELAEIDMQEQIKECYFLEYYPNPYVDSLVEFSSIEDWEYSKAREIWEYGLEELDNMPSREKWRKKV